MSAARLLGPVLTLLSLCACTSLSSYQFGPSPQSQDILLAGNQVPIVRAQFSSLGVGKVEGALEMRFRMRLQNPGAEGLEVAPEVFELIDGALRTFGPVRLDAAAGLQVAPGATVLVDVIFPFPDGAKPQELDGLSLRWGVRSGADVWMGEVSFLRLYRVSAYYPGYYGYYGYYGYHAYPGWYYWP